MKSFISLLWLLLFAAPVVAALVETPGFILALLGFLAFIVGGIWLAEKLTGLKP